MKVLFGLLELFAKGVAAEAIITDVVTVTRSVGTMNTGAICTVVKSAGRWFAIA